MESVFPFANFGFSVQKDYTTEKGSGSSRLSLQKDKTGIYLFHSILKDVSIYILIYVILLLLLLLRWDFKVKSHLDYHVICT